MMNNSIPAPTIVPTKVADNRGTPDTFSTLVTKVGTKVTAITTAIIADMKPVIYSLTSGIFIKEIFELGI